MKHIPADNYSAVSMSNDGTMNHKNYANILTCWAGWEGGSLSFLFLGSITIHSGVGHLMMIHSGSPFLAGLASAKGSIHHWLHCSLGVGKQTESRISISVTDLYNVKQDIAVIGAHAPQDTSTCTSTVTL